MFIFIILLLISNCFTLFSNPDVEKMETLYPLNIISFANCLVGKVAHDSVNFIYFIMTGSLRLKTANEILSLANVQSR